MACAQLFWEVLYFQGCFLAGEDVQILVQIPSAPLTYHAETVRKSAGARNLMHSKNGKACLKAGVGSDTKRTKKSDKTEGFYPEESARNFRFVHHRTLRDPAQQVVLRRDGLAAGSQYLYPVRKMCGQLRSASFFSEVCPFLFDVRIL